MITLFGTGPIFGLPHASPFAIKVEMLLKLAKLPYQVKYANMAKAPKGKLPWIDDSGIIVADSRLIKTHLETAHGADFTGGYSPRELAFGLALERTVENFLYWFSVENRWLVPENFARGPRHLFSFAPALLRPVIAQVILRKIRRDVAAQGINRLSSDEKLTLVRQSYQAISDILQDRSYVLGNNISGVDATVYAFLISGEAALFTSIYGDEIRALPNLMDYMQRMHAEFFPS